MSANGFRIIKPEESWRKAELYWKVCPKTNKPLQQLFAEYFALTAFVNNLVTAVAQGISVWTCLL